MWIGRGNERRRFFIVDFDRFYYYLFEDEAKINERKKHKRIIKSFVEKLWKNLSFPIWEHKFLTLQRFCKRLREACKHLILKKTYKKWNEIMKWQKKREILKMKENQIIFEMSVQNISILFYLIFFFLSLSDEISFCFYFHVSFECVKWKRHLALVIFFSYFS